MPEMGTQVPGLAWKGITGIPDTKGPFHSSVTIGTASALVPLNSKRERNSISGFLFPFNPPNLESEQESPSGPSTPELC